jgi:urocanate reductase
MHDIAKTKIDRRSLIQAGAAFGVATAVMGAAGKGSAPVAQAQEASTEGVDSDSIEWADSADMIVVGGGGAGFAASIEASDAGLSVLVLEKSGLCGGDTLRSAGMMMAGGTSVQKEFGIEDTAENFAKCELANVGDCCNRDMVEEACLASADEIDFMRNLGRNFGTITPMKPIAGNNVDDIWAKRVHWDPEYMQGHFLTLRKAADERGVRQLVNTEVKHLITNADGEVIGVQDVDGKNYRANRGVLLSTASFGHNKEMSQRYNKMNYWVLSIEENFPNVSTFYGNPYNTGDGIRMGQEIGADLALSPANCIQDITNLGSCYPQAGSILVNPEGKRFVQENAIWGYVNQMAYNEAVKLGVSGLDTSKINFWVIADQPTVDMNECYHGLANAVRAETNEEKFANDSYFQYVQKADTIEELAELTELPKDSLVETVNHWNDMVAAGEDTDFHRHNITEDDDFEPISTPPYYAFPLMPFGMGSFGGLRTDGTTQVVDIYGEPIPRLYAAGSIISGMFTAPFYNSCGWSVMNTVHWGRKAGQQIAALEPWTTDDTAHIELPDEEELAQEGIANANGNYKAGTYSDTEPGRNADVTVSVEFSDKAITAVTIGENSETPGLGGASIDLLPNRILAAQSADIDTITGSTLTSVAILAAVDACIKQAQA